MQIGAEDEIECYLSPDPWNPFEPIEISIDTWIVDMGQSISSENATIDTITNQAVTAAECPKCSKLEQSNYSPKWLLCKEHIWLQQCNLIVKNPLPEHKLPRAPSL